MVLIIFITHKSNQDNSAENPGYRKIYFWQDENKAYSLLLHSVTINDRSFSAYSIKWDSLMIFPALPSELQSIKKIMKDYSFKNQQCSSCHESR